ncbi:MAG: cytochrome c3 family protein [Candidatus Thiodiazotropha sp. (ex Lucinoma aequizonata)]|nr:cytochrome c3 family protein [Candidatus Thiodiazotropha sp. (ex Lucinoma aequizonata)]MCU7888925.1 cytochrome c3 family protein [Candidatus Thiodiazotropha sp. (ex Lucinoma aequizonata)]MCU7894035.1 cytochrome c3 family protein [Candidatus Thiodiazotropha sp. (ex Lucinoma aequizonata)]MCU7899026.1 cytochrome c3 family protein [Candidatus Thiodiazotropha sp. (ex Lucinoma aequizonata)]MCU7902585.1 cytochrome c3 family protein [Candidatus Thiodiazotropha sp. (ex Lucinoma aequizonata)]
MRIIFTLLLLLLLISGLAQGKAFTNTECLECHGEKGFSVPLGKDGEGDKRSLFIDSDATAQSVHGALICTDCHQDIEQLPHRKKKLQQPDCVSCHEQISGAWSPKGRGAWLVPEPPRVVTHVRDFTLSAHANVTIENNAKCSTCHTAHYVFPSDDSRASTYRFNSPELCGACHEKALTEYRFSMHGAALKTPWKWDSATCSDCHSAHKISDMKQLNAHRVVTENCGGCHENELDGYMASPHGQLAWHGNQDAPKCVDCHSGHDIVHVSKAISPVNEVNRVETCQKCHKEGNEQFAKYDPHATTRNFEKYPGMWLIGKGMGALIILLLLFFYTHSALWFWREKKERPVIYRRSESRSYPVRVKPEKKHCGIHFQRFIWYWRVNHWLLALSLMTLVFTGMVIMYPNTDWAMAVVPMLGGTKALNNLHHWIGIIFLLAIFSHGTVVLWRVMKMKDFDWFGPDSLLPRKKDWEDIKGQFLWYFGKGEQPRFDRWTYWEKFDYWAVYWGAFVSGVSGILLWFAESIGQVLPGWIFNIATVAHGLEAFLAVMTLFVVHFFNNHFRPAKFPLDTVMFTGSWNLEEFKEERPEEYERLKASGELEKRLVAPPSKRWDLLSHLLGFFLLGTGLMLLVLVIDGFLTRGLF